jgi:FAD/FMN-containing dehydrogenase/Fe-S oxidoreductase
MARLIERPPDSYIPPVIRKQKPTSVDARGLAADLRRQIDGEVRFDEGSRALYATDGSNYRQVPIGVVVPRSTDAVVQTIALCRSYGAPVLPRGCGTSLAGNCCNVAVVMDCSKYLHHILTLNPQQKMARVQPGAILDDLRHAAEQHHLTFGPDPATHNHCTLGGMIGNNSCGVHSVMAGRTADNIEELEIVTYDGLRMRVGQTSAEELEQIIRTGGRRGEIYRQLKALSNHYADLIRQRYPKIPRRVSGYNLDELLPENGFNVARALVGTEGTCVTVLEATTRLVYSPPARSLLVLGYPDAFSAGDHVTQVMEHSPVGLEGIDSRLISFARKKKLHPEDIELLPEGGGWLLVEFGGESKEESDDHARKLMEALRHQRNAPSMKLFDDSAQEKMVWEIRESGLGATAFVPGEPDAWPGWEDSAVPPERVGDYLRDLRNLMDKYHYEAALYGHFGQGCIHCRISFDLTTAEGVRQYRSFVSEAADLVVSYGGSLSGEHGDGQSRAEFLPKMFGEELVGAFREFKSIWDPDWQMNPGKVVNPHRADDNLRLGPTYEPPQPKTHFQYPEDHGSFARATLRCVGVGKCRRTGGGTMCPSYMVTREEEDTTRGRAHALFEMLQGSPISRGWHDPHVKEALDLCLSCKGCKGDCPVNVDMATYKAEFLSHYYAGRLRPRSAYAMGLISIWARLASVMPGLANAVTQTPVLRTLVKAAGGIAPERDLPLFAGETFKAWFNKRGSRQMQQAPTQQSKVILWPDTFNNYFHPETARAAVEVLETLGYQIEVPKPALCCGRPLYDYGMLDTAKRWLRQIIETLRPEIEAGVPIVGLEPSCVAVFRDELVNLFPNDQDAKRLSQQTFLLSEFLEQKASDYQPPHLHRKAIVHGHCHHKAVMGMSAEEKMLKKLGLDFTVLDSGCCGMAGSFGFEAGEHYDVSIKAGERVLLPAVRDAARDTLILADGFSCRTQIEQETERGALHLAQILQMALRDGSQGPTGDFPERAYLTTDYPRSPLKLAALAGGGLALLSGALVWGLRRWRHS